MFYWTDYALDFQWAKYPPSMQVMTYFPSYTMDNNHE